MIDVNDKAASDLGLTKDEFEKIIEILGRVPNYNELCIYATMWSEHISYKNSIQWLKKLPREGKGIIASVGSENAGLVDLGDDLACAFKIESCNHPTAVEPFNGAAAGVAGIARDIFSLGARPLAQLFSVRVGDLKDEETKTTLTKIVKGLGNYGNALGVPVVGGETGFDKSYSKNPIVNTMSVGVLNKHEFISSVASGEGNKVLLVGARTGRDGIKGAMFASAEITKESYTDNASVQVANPFFGKILMDAILEIRHIDGLIGIHDIGAGGIVSAVAEMASRDEFGMRIILDEVPLREDDMLAHEIMLSQSQERMIVVVKSESEEDVKNVFEKWDLTCCNIGEVIQGDWLHFLHNSQLIADVPIGGLVADNGAPVYDKEYKTPEAFEQNQKFKIDDVEEPSDLKKVAEMMIKNVNVASKHWIFDQFDSTVGTNNLSTNFPTDAGVVNIKNTNKALVLAVDGNSRYTKANPKEGAAIAVAEAARNIVCSGGEPLAVTNCLNFGSPENKEIYWEFVNAIQGITYSCEKFNLPVTGGNVSFNNQADINGNLVAIRPTPVIGMVGLMQNKNHQMTMAFKNKGHMIFIIGRSQNDISSSEYLAHYHKIEDSPSPHFDIDHEVELQDVMKNLIKNNLIKSAHDVADGGLFVALLESCMHRSFGFDITSDAEVRADAFLFGEAQSRIIVSVSQSKETAFIDFMLEKKFPFSALGHVTKGELRIDDVSYGFIEDVKKDYQNAIENVLKGK